MIRTKWCWTSSSIIFFSLCLVLLLHRTVHWSYRPRKRANKHERRYFVFFSRPRFKSLFYEKKTFFLYRTPFFYEANIHIICDRGVVKEAKYSSQQKINFLALDARIRNILLLFLEFKYRKIFSSGGKGNPFKPKNIYQKQFLIKLKKLYFSWKQPKRWSSLKKCYLIIRHEYDLFT